MVEQNKLSAAARTIPEAVAVRDEQLALPPDRLPPAAKRLVVQSLIKAGLIEEVQADDKQPAWRTTEDGTRYVLRITPAGLEAIGVVSASIRPAKLSGRAGSAAHSRDGE